jgi:SAM-dependent methyltransferase
MRDWLAFWNAPNRIYVNDRHRDVHYRDVAIEIRSLVPSPSATVLDYGCGEATAAHLVAEAAGRLILSDGAPAMREKLAARFKDDDKIAVRSPEEVAVLPPGSVDLIVLNSVAQYLDPAQFAALLALFKRLLGRDGRLVVGDVIPPRASAVTATMALMRLAWRHDFLGPALLGLVRTVFSNYRALRNRLGLTHYSEAEMVEALRRAGFAARRRYPNLEHNQERMTFIATPVEAKTVDSRSCASGNP